jgi:tetratricopeptide (TPR) repeat protein
VMDFRWFDASAVAKIGVALADEFAPPQSTSARRADQSVSNEPDDALLIILRRADLEVRSLRLNFYKKARFANSFKWRLLENGVREALADEVTQRLVVHLSATPSGAVPGSLEMRSRARRHQSDDVKYLLTRANRSMAAGAYTDAIPFYEKLIALNPRHVIALNNLGSALHKIGRYKQAEVRFREVIRIKPDFADAHSNIGASLLLTGLYDDAEYFLRHALKLRPRFVEARINLALVLNFLGRLRDAKSHLQKALKYEPRNVEALLGMALTVRSEGNFDEASTLLSRALQVSPKMPRALASQAAMRKMTSSDRAWLASAEEVAASGLEPVDESDLRFAIGKYYDDVEDFKQAFQNYTRANELLKPLAEPYDGDAYRRFVDRMIQVYAPGVVAPGAGSSSSMKPVFVVGMPRSGTSLSEQIIASHPSARGAGELGFWSHAVHEREAAMGAGQLGESARHKLAEDYLRILGAGTGDALRIVDKAPVNSDSLGIIHSVFPNARIIYMRRNPIDTCLSCYFQRFSLALNFTMDLSDLVDYYRHHERLVAHWRSVLPPGTILDVPYEELVADQRGWSRKILDFLGLDWDEQVLDFHDTKRVVATASFWQVRQKIYKNSVQRWRNYERFIAPLLDLNDST